MASALSSTLSFSDIYYDPLLLMDEVVGSLCSLFLGLSFRKFLKGLIYKAAFYYGENVGPSVYFGTLLSYYFGLLLGAEALALTPDALVDS